MLEVQSPMSNCSFQVVTQIQTDMAPEPLPVAMVRKDRHAFDS